MSCTGSMPFLLGQSSVRQMTRLANAVLGKGSAREARQVPRWARLHGEAAGPAAEHREFKGSRGPAVPRGARATAWRPTDLLGSWPARQARIGGGHTSRTQTSHRSCRAGRPRWTAPPVAEPGACGERMRAGSTSRLVLFYARRARLWWFQQAFKAVSHQQRSPLLTPLLDCCMNRTEGTQRWSRGSAHAVACHESCACAVRPTLRVGWVHLGPLTSSFHICRSIGFISPSRSCSS